MNGGPSRRFQPVEPGENKGGFRKVKRGEGAPTVFGVSAKKTSDGTMRVLGGIFLALCFLVSAYLVTAVVFESPLPLGFFWGLLVTTHLFLLGAEMVTGRELPTRMRGMATCWGTILVLAMVGFVMSLFS